MCTLKTKRYFFDKILQKLQYQGFIMRGSATLSQLAFSGKSDQSLVCGRFLDWNSNSKVYKIKKYEQLQYNGRGKMLMTHTTELSGDVTTGVVHDSTHAPQHRSV